jgi:hypothetical protein
MIKIDTEGSEKFLLTDDVYDIISKCSHLSLEVHFKSTARTSDYFLTWDTYNDWLKQFESTHDILYYRSRKKNGWGHYLLKRK